MTIAFAAFLAVHGAIHLLGFVKAYGLAPVAQLERAIAPSVGLLWLAAAAGFVASAVLLVVERRYWWMAAAPALVLSQVLIVMAWGDARLGTVANAIALVPVALALVDLRPGSLRSTYEREAARAEARVAAVAPDASGARPVTEADLGRLPVPVATYLRRAGVVGKPRVRSFHAILRAEFRMKADAPFMPATAEQHNFYDQPARLFFMRASRFGVPFDAFHRYVADAATMQVRVAGVIPFIDARGPEMTQGETVTLLNDMCFLAPAALVDAPISWQAIDGRQVRATFSNAGNTVSAVLSFDERGDLVGFVSADRYQSDGRTHRLVPWSTPLRDYRDFGGHRLASVGEARWQEPAGEWTYGRFALLRIGYNGAPLAGP